MLDDLEKPLARTIYEAHMKSRGIKTTWSNLSSVEREHWRKVSAAVLSFLGEYAITEEEAVSPLFI